MSVLTWVNTVRIACGQTALQELADADPSNPSPGRRSRLAQSLPKPVRAYAASQGVYLCTSDEKAAQALQGAGAEPAAAPSGGVAYGYLLDRVTGAHGYDLWAPRIVGMFEAAA